MKPVSDLEAGFLHLWVAGARVPRQDQDLLAGSQDVAVTLVLQETHPDGPDRGEEQQRQIPEHVGRIDRPDGEVKLSCHCPGSASVPWEGLYGV